VLEKRAADAKAEKAVPRAGRQRLTTARSGRATSRNMREGRGWKEHTQVGHRRCGSLPKSPYTAKVPIKSGRLCCGWRPRGRRQGHLAKAAVNKEPGGHPAGRGCVMRSPAAQPEEHRQISSLGGLLPLLVNCAAWVIRPDGEAQARPASDQQRNRMLVPGRDLALTS
jgi:hypothetical protein